MCVCAGGRKNPGSLGLHPHSLHPDNSTCAAMASPQRCRNTLGEKSRGRPGSSPLDTSQFSHLPSSAQILASSRERSLRRAKPNTRSRHPPGVGSQVPGFETPPRGADSPPRAPSRVPARRRPHRDAFQVGGRHGELRTGRAGCGDRWGRGGDEPAAGRAPPGRLRLNGSNMATSWKLPLAAAAGEAAEPAPPPPAGPASLPGSAPAQHAPRGWDRPGVSAAWREVLAAGAAGTCSLRGGGARTATSGGPRPLSEACCMSLGS